MLLKMIFTIILITSTGAFAGECVMSYAALSQFDGHEKSFFDHHSRTRVPAASANDCAAQAASKLGTQREFKAETRYTKRNELRTIAIVNYEFQGDELSLKGKVQLTEI